MEKINLDLLKFEINIANNSYRCNTLFNDFAVCKCQINKENNTWTISSWYTDKNYLNKGIGAKTLKYLLQHLYDKFGCPENIEYIWNGANQYVYDWIEKNFDAISKCPLAVQKTQCEDDWNSHIYHLNVKKVLKYFTII